MFTEEDVTHIDDDSIIVDKPDCVLFLRPAVKGFLLKDVNIPGIDKAAPLAYALEVPIDIKIPDNVSSHEFAIQTLATFSPDFDSFVKHNHEKARLDSADFYISLVEIFGTDLLQITGKVNWRMFAFSCHNRTRDSIVGVDNLIYYNVSKKLDALGVNCVSLQ